MSKTSNSRFPRWGIILIIIGIILVAAFFLMPLILPPPNNSYSNPFFQNNSPQENSIPFPVSSTWTTDQPASYSNLVTLVFTNSTNGVKYELVNNTGYMAEGFAYTILNGKIIQMINYDNSTQKIPFLFQNNNELIIDYNGQNITLQMDYENSATKNVYSGM